MRILSIGDEVQNGTYQLHSRFRRAVNFTDGRRLVTLVTPDIGAGPANIVVRDLTPFGSTSNAPLNAPLACTRVESPQPRDSSPPLLHHAPQRGRREDLRVDRYSVVFANRRFLLSETQSYGSLLHIEKETSRAVFRKNLQIVENILVETSHPKSLAFLLDAKRERNFRSAFDQAFVAQIKDGASRMLSASGVRRLAGCGFGLTPSGDDFIAGMLIGLNVLRACSGRRPRRRCPHAPGDGHLYIHAIYAAAAGSNLLSNSFLRLARDGRVNEKMQRLVTALFRRGGAEIKERADAVMATGETSGADLLTGFVMTVKRY
jgi:hypothetical protein